MARILTYIVILLAPVLAFSAFSNPNSILIGEQSAGMGGAYTALYGDSSAAGFYNPASLVFIEGNNVSASATLFNKFDTSYGEGGNIVQAGQRVNRGFFRTIPSSIGNVYRYKEWAFGFNIIVPDYDFFAGNIASTSTTQSFLNYTDESLWSGFVASYKWNENHSFGATLYYTARSLIRSSLDRTEVAANHEIITSEEKSIKHNGVLFVLGYLWKISPTWSLGVSARPPIINFSGEGAYFQSITDTNNLPSQTIQYKSTKAFTYVPPKYTLGVAYQWNDRLTFSIDGSYYTAYSYRDMADSNVADLIEHVETWNAAFGAEYKFQDPAFRLRAGVFTNNSSHPDVPVNPTTRLGDHLNLIGFSGNIAFFVSENSQYSVGGFYYGGDGHSVQKTGNQLTRLDKNHQVFSLLISTSYKF